MSAKQSTGIAKANQATHMIELVALHITSVCSHRCPFCYAADESKPQKHPPLNQLKRVVDALSDGQVKEVSFLGGDPGAYPHVVPLARYVVKKGMRASILSNTLRFPKSSITEAAQYFHAMEATIHDVDAQRHDSFCRARGAYARVTQQLKSASEYGCKTGIAVNVIPEIADRLFELVENIVVRERVPLDYVVLQRIIPFGRASQSSRFPLTRKHVEEALHQIRRIDKELGISISVEDPFPLCVLPSSLRKYMNPCQWGYTKASVSATGDLSRCGADPRYRLGNILNTPLLEIWNNSPILRSFRSRSYLPGRCLACPDLEKCGGGCPLSCEIDKDHGVDYLYVSYETIDKQIHGDISFGRARPDELSSILQIEWNNFQGYGHLFTVENLKQWFEHNPNMFWVVRDSRNWVLGYAAMIPVSQHLFNRILQGELCSLTEFPARSVLTEGRTDCFHLEVLATVPARTASRAGRYLIRCIGEYLVNHAKRVSASPITDIGVRLCKYFGFRHMADSDDGNHSYPVYSLDIIPSEMENKLKKF